MHYASVLATSPRHHWYAKWLNINSVSYSSLMAAASLSTARWFALETLRDLSRGSAFLPGTSPVNEGRNLDAEINAQAAVIFGLYGDTPPTADLCALSVNTIRILFRRMTMIYLNRIFTNPYLEEESVSVSDWPKIAYLAKLISNSFPSIDRGNDPWHRIWNGPVHLV